MALVIAYGSNRFVVGEMTKKQKTILKKDKPELWAKYCNKKQPSKSVAVKNATN